MVTPLKLHPKQRGRKGVFKSLILKEEPDANAKRLAIPAAPPHFAPEESELWRIILLEHPNLAGSATALASLAVAMEANAIVRHCTAEIREHRYDAKFVRLCDIQSRAVKAYTNAMRQLKVL